MDQGLSANRAAAGGYLLGHLMRFGQLLRVMGVDVSTRQILDLIEALEHVPLGSRSDFYHTCRALLVNRREEFVVFEQAFQILWQMEGSDEEQGGGPSEGDRARRLRLPASPQTGPRPDPYGKGRNPKTRTAGGTAQHSRQDSAQDTASEAVTFDDDILRRQDDEEGSGPLRRGKPGEDEDDEQETSQVPFMVYSADEILRRKDFGEMTWEEIQEAKQAMARLEWRLGERRTRRLRPHAKGRLHLRRVFRDNLRHGGEPIRLAFRQRVYRPRSLVILCDISGSMDRYSRMLLHFVHALTHGLRSSPQTRCRSARATSYGCSADVEVFVFGTQLTRITHHLRSRDVDESLDQVGATVSDWSGGTRIGEALKTFNFQWARRVLGRGSVMLVISDGWDRGDLKLLAQEIHRLQRSAYRLIWLNPLLGSQEYQPVQRGMATIMPCVDDFLPVHNLISLTQLAQTLSTVATQRPVRKQRLCAPAPEEESEHVDSIPGRRDSKPSLRRAPLA